MKSSPDFSDQMLDLIPADVPEAWRAAPPGINASLFFALLAPLCSALRPSNVLEYLLIYDHVEARLAERRIALLAHEHQLYAAQPFVEPIIEEVLSDCVPDARKRDRIFRNLARGDGQAWTQVDAALASIGLTRAIFDAKGLAEHIGTASQIDAMRRARRRQSEFLLSHYGRVKRLAAGMSRGGQDEGGPQRPPRPPRLQ